MASTKTDKFAIDWAGVEAGAKIFVPLGDEPFRSLAHNVADQARKGIVCASNRNVEDFLHVDTNLLPISAFEIRTITRVRNFSLILTANRAPQFLTSGIRLNQEQACYQSEGHSYLPHWNRDQDQPSHRPEHQLRTAGARRTDQCHSSGSCVKCHCVVTNVETRLRPMQVKRTLRRRISWQRNCMDLA